MSTTDLVPGSTGAIVTASDFGGGITVEGRDEGGVNLSRVALFHGTSEEEATYGSHKKGVWLDTLECRELGTAIRIMPAFAWAEYAVWEEGKKQPTHKWERKTDVPAELLEWKDGANGKRIRPEAREAVIVVCAVQRKEGEQWVLEPWPYKLVFKSTGLKAWNNSIGPLENRRSAIGRCPGCYELSTVDDKNTNAQAFKRLVSRPVGEAPADMATMAKLARQNKSSVKAAAQAMPEEPSPDEGDFNPDAH